MKMLKIVALTLVSALSLIPALATAQGVTTVGFTKLLHSHAWEGETFREIKVRKTGPAEVKVLWIVGGPEHKVTVHGHATFATPNVDYAVDKGSLYFGPGNDTKTIPVEILQDEIPDEPLEMFFVGIALDPNPNAHSMGQTVTLSGSPTAFMRIWPQGKCNEELPGHDLTLPACQ